MFAHTQYIDGSELVQAVNAAWTHRGLLGAPFFAPPRTWQRLYPAVARRVVACGDVLTVAAAVEITTALLNPALDRDVFDQQWSPGIRAWVSM